MNIIVEEAVLQYAKKNQIQGICVENTPVGCSCVGIHIHAQPEYLFELSKYEKSEVVEKMILENGFPLFIEKSLLPIEEIKIFGKHNPFNNKLYLHCELKRL